MLASIGGLARRSSSDFQPSSSSCETRLSATRLSPHGKRAFRKMVKRTARRYPSGTPASTQRHLHCGIIGTSPEGTAEPSPGWSPNAVRTESWVRLELDLVPSGTAGILSSAVPSGLVPIIPQSWFVPSAAFSSVIWTALLLSVVPGGPHFDYSASSRLQPLAGSCLLPLIWTALKLNRPRGFQASRAL